MKQTEIKKLLEEASYLNCTFARREEIKMQLTLSLIRVPCLQEPFRSLLNHLFEQLKDNPEWLALQWPAVAIMCNSNPLCLDKLDPSLFNDRVLAPIGIDQTPQ